MTNSVVKFVTGQIQNPVLLFNKILPGEDPQLIRIMPQREALQMMLCADSRVRVHESSRHDVVTAGGARINVPRSLELRREVSRSTVWSALAPFSREKAWKRDGWTCAVSGQRLMRNHPDMWLRASYDHIWPRQKGGVDCWRNTITMSAQLNSLKSNKRPRFSKEGDFVQIVSPHDDLGHGSGYFMHWLAELRARGIEIDDKGWVKLKFPAYAPTEAELLVADLAMGQHDKTSSTLLPEVLTLLQPHLSTDRQRSWLSKRAA